MGEGGSVTVSSKVFGLRALLKAAVPLTLSLPNGFLTMIPKLALAAFASVVFVRLVDAQQVVWGQCTCLRSL